MFQNCVNSKKKGDIGVAVAIAEFAKKGQTVLFPLSDSEPYDLAFDDGKKLNKVQVRTTESKQPNGNFKVNLRVFGGNQSYHTVQQFDKTKVDFLFILTEIGDKYLIPSSDINNVNSLTLCQKTERYKL